ncbi:MAG: flagellar hook-basal body complex protein, partial [Deltaproteobacteria bacterium]|nr:flagellar hook-basal body complex protein [Deltaproteobacteria bacterium]
MIGSLYSGASGVQTHSESMTVTGSNIANVNTIGYKHNRVNFQDLLSTSVGGDTKIGQGVTIGNIQNVHKQGSFEATEVETDVAIDGNGFFSLRDEAGNLYYTRAGQFAYDKNGFLTSQDGKFLQVKDVNLDTNESVGPLKNINILDQIDPPIQTGDGIKEGTGVSIKANLDTNSKIIDVALDYDNVRTEMYNFSTSVTVYDSKGNEHAVDVVFRKLEDKPEDIDPATGQPIPGTAIQNNWQWMVLAPGDILEGGVPGVMKAMGGGFLEFSDDGRLISDTPGLIQTPPLPPGAPPGTEPPPPEMIRQPIVPDQPSQIDFNFVDAGPNPQKIGFKFGNGSNPDDPTDIRTGMDGLTQFASESKIIDAMADGIKSGKIESIYIRTDGTIDGAFDSGRVKALGRLALTDFKAREKLQIKGENLYAMTFESGPAIVNDPNKAGMGTVNSKSLEHSNVELSHEFVN